MKKLIYIGFLSLLALASCHHTNKQEHKSVCGEDHDHPEISGSHADEIILPPSKAEAAGVKTAHIEPGAFRQVIKVSGQVLAAQGDESIVVATVPGVVSFRTKVTEGMGIGQGAPLLTISSSNIAEGDPVLRARIAYEGSKREYERMKALVSNKIVSEKDFAQAEQNHESARISYEALAKNHSTKGQNITAPIGGYVKSILIKEGDYVTVGQPLMSVTQSRRLFLRAEVPERYYSYLRTIHSANFRTPYDNRVYELTQLDGKLLSFGKTSGEQSFYVPVTFEFDNRGDILPGSFVEVYLLSAPLTEVIFLPRTALTEEQGSFYVYLKAGQEGYHKQKVTLGTDNGKEVQILSGIKPGDCVVIEEPTQVRLAGTSSVLPGHTH